MFKTKYNTHELPKSLNVGDEVFLVLGSPFRKPIYVFFKVRIKRITPTGQIVIEERHNVTYKQYNSSGIRGDNSIIIPINTETIKLKESYDYINKINMDIKIYKANITVINQMFTGDFTDTDAILLAQQKL